MTKTLTIFSIILLLATFAAVPVYSRDAEVKDNNIDRYYQRKREGWFWKERMPEPEPEVKPEAAPPPAAVPDVNPLSPSWLRTNLPRLLDEALESPTPENVKKYFYAQRSLMDMGERFATMAQTVSLSDPLLDENNRRPIATYAADVVDAEALRNKEELTKKIAGQAGIWYFFRSDCPYCKTQNPVLARIANKLGLVVLPISLDGAGMPDGVFSNFVPDRGQAAELGVTTSPTIFMVRPPNEYVLVTEGLVSEQGMVDRMIAGAFEAGWINESDMESTRPMKPIVPINPDNEIMKALLTGVASTSPTKPR